MVAPGESLPTAEVLSSMPSSTSTSGSPAATSPASSQSTTTTHDSKLSSGAIAGIVVGGIAVLALIGTLLYFFARHRTMIQFLKRDHHVANQQPPGPDMMAPHLSPFSPQTPSMPYSPGDARFGEYPGQAAPPYPKYAQQTEVAELSSPPLDGYRPSSRYSDTTAYDGPRNVASPHPPHSLVDVRDSKGYVSYLA